MTRWLLLLAVFVWPCLAGELEIGKPLELAKSIAVDELMADPQPYLGKPVQVSGRVTEVCRMMGCWMELAGKSGKHSIRIKVRDGDLVFPKEAIGRQALAEGTLTKFELTREQAIAAAKHEAEEMGRKFDPSSIKSGRVVYQLAGTGAKVSQ
jgi:hypothetical protein